MKKQTFIGYLFMSSGCEHGPEIMQWIGEWDEKKYGIVKDKSWCSNNFFYSYDEDGDTDYDSDNPTAISVCEEMDLEPGKKYKITVEEI